MPILEKKKNSSYRGNKKSKLNPNRTSLVAQMVKSLPTMQETRVPSLGWEDPLEKEMVNHSSILAWKIPWTEKPVGLHTVHRSQRGGDDFT